MVEDTGRLGLWVDFWNEVAGVSRRQMTSNGGYCGWGGGDHVFHFKTLEVKLLLKVLPEVTAQKHPKYVSEFLLDFVFSPVWKRTGHCSAEVRMLLL